jgi:tyrosyl-tRNA synthetase
MISLCIVFDGCVWYGIYIADGRRLVESGSVTVNGRRIAAPATPKDMYCMMAADILSNNHSLIRYGKRNLFIVRII